jgi:hypothetical protein
VLQLRASDHAGDPVAAYTPDGVPGAWQPAAPNGPVVTPNWGNVTPFVMTSGAQFRPPIPGGAGSYADLLAGPEYAEQFNEVKTYGSVNSTVRTADQTQAAFFGPTMSTGRTSRRANCCSTPRSSRTPSRCR